MEKQQLEALLKEMSLEEKVGQLFQIIGYYYVEEGKKFITNPERIYGASAPPDPSSFYDGCDPWNEDHFSGSAGSGGYL